MNYKRYREYQNRWNREALAKKHESNPDAIGCSICGKKYIKVCGHVWQTHGLNNREYKKKFGYDLKKGLVTKEYKEKMSKKVFENGTINNLKIGRKYWFKKGQEGVGRYQRSKQTMARLRKQLFINK